MALSVPSIYISLSALGITHLRHLNILIYITQGIDTIDLILILFESPFIILHT